MEFLKSLVSKKLAVTTATIALIQSLPMTADWKGICTAIVALAFLVAQAYVDAQTVAAPPAQEPSLAPKPLPEEEDERGTTAKITSFLALVLVAVTLQTGCAEAKPYLRTANDIAGPLCSLFYSQKQGISVEQAAELFCKTQKQIEPWLDQVLALQSHGIVAGAAEGCKPVEE